MLGHHVSVNRLEVDIGKINIISKLPPAKYQRNLEFLRTRWVLQEVN